MIECNAIIVWCAVGLDGTRIYRPNNNQAESAARRMSTNALDVISIKIPLSKAGVIAALNEAAKHATYPETPK